MSQLFQNNAESLLADPIVAGDTVITVANGAGFPAIAGGDFFMLTLIGLDDSGNENAWEIVKVTARSGNTLTVVRAQEGTAAVGWPGSTRCELRITAGTLGDITTNAREWSADTVPQAEAEAGVATTRRAWTAQRVLQAAVAWWDRSAAKTKLDGIQAGAQVNAVTSVAGKSGAVTLETLTRGNYLTGGNYNGSEAAAWAVNAAANNTPNTVVARDGSGNFSAGTISAALNGNASAATVLATARAINGTNFNGSSAITTANWGAARTLRVGMASKSVNGSENVTWTLAEIGAAEVSHYHPALHIYDWDAVWLSSFTSARSSPHAWAGAQTFNGFTALGEQSPAVKTKLLAFTSGAAGVTISVAHGVSDPMNNIISVQIHVWDGVNKWPALDPRSAYALTYDITATHIRVTTGSAASVTASRSGSILIIYKG